MANLIKGGQTTQWPTLSKEDRQHNGQPYQRKTDNTMASLIKGGQTTQWPALYRTDNTMANLIKGRQTTQWPPLSKEDRQHNGQPYQRRTDNTMAKRYQRGNQNP
jgi:hypothetical protein